MSNSQVLKVSPLHNQVVLFLSLLSFHILNFLYNQLQHQAQSHLLHFAFLLQTYLEEAHKLYLAHVHTLSYLHPSKMGSYLLKALFFHIVLLFQEEQAFCVLKKLENPHLIFVHQFSYVVYFETHL